MDSQPESKRNEAKRNDMLCNIYIKLYQLKHYKYEAIKGVGILIFILELQ